MTTDILCEPPHKIRRRYSIAAVALLLIGTLVVLRLSPSLVAAVFSGNVAEWQRVMLWEFRLPRLVMTLMIGSGMAISGWATQKATRNPLASPDILAVPAAAMFGVMLVLWLSSGQLLKSRTLPLAASVSGTLAAVLLFSLVGRRRQLDGSGLLLVGIALGCLLSAVSFLIALNAHPSTYEYATAWLAGSLGRASWQYVWMLLPAWWFLSLTVAGCAERITVLQFEDDVVCQLGGRPDLWRRATLCLSAALCAACIGVGGGFGFIGFIVPNLARGSRQGSLDSPWPIACMGALLLLCADVIGQVAFAPGEVPAGVVISMIGAPCFVLILLRRRLVETG